MILLIIGVILAILLFHYWFTNIFNFWKKQGIRFYTKYNPYVDILRIFFSKSVIYDEVKDAYNGMPDRQVYGTFTFRLPRLLVKDPDLIRNICVKDFDHFVNHVDVIFKDDEVFGKTLFALKDKKWRDMRILLTPVFTGAKLRGFFHLILECGEQTVNYCVQEYKKQQNNKILKVKLFDVAKKFSNDVIATTSFGVNVNSVSYPNNEFFVAGHEVTKFATWRFILIIFFPTLSKIFNVRIAPGFVYNFFGDIIKETVRIREEQNIIRYDLIHLLMEARKGQLKQIKKKQANNEDVSGLSKNLLTNEDFTAQGFIFFLAGYKNVAITASFAAYELALQPDIQKKVQDEIGNIIKNNNGKLDYDVLKQMKYLDMVVSETLRKWPPLALIDRECSKPYKLEADGEIIEVAPGTHIHIPVAGFHFDPKYYPNPEKFDPERFNDENKANMNPYTYLPFGIGPRVCIGVRLVLVEVKLFLVHLLTKFDVVVTEKTPIPLQLATGNILKPKDDFYLGLKLRT